MPGDSEVYRAELETTNLELMGVPGKHVLLRRTFDDDSDPHLYSLNTAELEWLQGHIPNLVDPDSTYYTSQNGGRSGGKLHTRRDCRHLVNVPDEKIVDGPLERFDADQEVCGTCGGAG